MLRTIRIELTDVSTSEIIGQCSKDTSSERQAAELVEKWSKCLQRGILQGKNLHMSITWKQFNAYDMSFLDYLDKDKDKPFL